MILIVEVVEASPSLLPFPESIESESKFSSVQIDIELTDSNDNSPIFQPTNLYSFTVDAMAGTGTVVGQVCHLLTLKKIKIKGSKVDKEKIFIAYIFFF